MSKKPFLIEESSFEKNQSTVTTRPFTCNKEERKSEELVVEVISNSREIAEVKIPQEQYEVKRVKPFEIRDSNNRCQQYQAEKFRSTDEDEKAEIVQEAHERKTTKPFEILDPMIARYSSHICQQFISEPSVEAERGIALVLQKEFRKNGVVLPNLVSCDDSHFLNFNLALKKKIIHIQDTERGELKKYKYCILVQVIQKNGKIKNFEATVSSEKVKEISWVTKATHSLASIPQGKDEKLEWLSKVQACIESDNVLYEMIYSNAGWREITENQWRYVYSDGVVGYENIDVHTLPKYNFTLEREKIGTIETFEQAMKMIRVTRNSTALELFLFTHMTVMSTLFEKSGFPIKFVFGIVGVTNSRKTSLALALSQIFGREKFIADAEFATATRCGIEKVLSTYKDGTVIIDDFKPGINRGQQNELNHKLDELVRMYGDRVPKKRMTDFLADGENKYFPIGGGCVLTMEVVTGVTSSITRMFLTELGKDDVQNDQLSFFQENRWVLDTHLYDFIMWLTNHFEEVINYLKNRIPQLRSERLYTIGRYDEMRSHFLVTAEILSQYARERNFWGEVERTSFQDYVKTAIEGEIFSMQQYIRRVDKGVCILRALDEVLKRGQIQTKELNENTCSQSLEIYDSEQILYIRSVYLITIVKGYFLKTYSSMDVISTDEVIGELERLEVIDILVKNDGKKERSRKLPLQRGNKNRYLYLKKEKMREILDGE